jgi:hypothetical protein
LQLKLSSYACEIRVLQPTEVHKWKKSYRKVLLSNANICGAELVKEFSVYLYYLDPVHISNITSLRSTLVASSYSPTYTYVQASI